jgi:hypothetical protein
LKDDSLGEDQILAVTGIKATQVAATQASTR